MFKRALLLQFALLLAACGPSADNEFSFVADPQEASDAVSAFLDEHAPSADVQVWQMTVTYRQIDAETIEATIPGGTPTSWDQLRTTTTSAVNALGSGPLDVDRREQQVPGGTETSVDRLEVKRTAAAEGVLLELSRYAERKSTLQIQWYDPNTETSTVLGYSETLPGPRRLLMTYSEWRSQTQ